MAEANSGVDVEQLAGRPRFGRTPEELGKRGIHNRAGEVTVAYVLENFVVGHAEQHLL